MVDDEFTPRLGRMRSRKARYVALVVKAARKAGISATSGRRFDGSRIGRGASLGRVLGSRDRHAGLRARRVMVKTRLMRLAGQGGAAARAHLRYLQRDGVTRDGEPGSLYAADRDVADGKAFLDRCDRDRHQFRFIVSAEDGDLYPDLKPFVRRLMAQMEDDLGTRLDWVAVDHFNTGHPHSHVLLRGRDDRGGNLVIARDYIAHGLRARAMEIATLDLGPRTDLEIEERLRSDAQAERLTVIDRRLLRDMDGERIVGASAPDPLQQALRAGRLQKLHALGLAEPVGQGRWRLADDLAATLQRMGERGDIIRTMQRELTARRLERAPAEHVIFDAGAADARPLVGRVIAHGLADEHRDRHYLIVDAIDGRTHYVDIGTPNGQGEGDGRLREGVIVGITPRRASVREVDRTIAAVAADNGGYYTVEAHLRHDPAASEAYVETHVRRLEAMRRAGAGVERTADGSWQIGPDHLDRVAALAARQLSERAVSVEQLTSTPLARLPTRDAATWLDRELVSDAPTPVRDAGFGREVRAAQALRRQWLIAEQLAWEQDGEVRYRPDLIAILQRRELMRVAGQLSAELNLEFKEVQPGERIEGRYVRAVDMVSGRHALIERSHEFTLVPWRPVLERQVGREVAGIMRSSGISWNIGRQRSGLEVS